MPQVEGNSELIWIVDEVPEVDRWLGKPKVVVSRQEWTGVDRSRHRRTGKDITTGSQRST